MGDPGPSTLSMLTKWLVDRYYPDWRDEWDELERQRRLDNGPSATISDHGGTESEDAPATEKSLVGLLTIGVEHLAPFVTPRERPALYFDGESCYVRVPTKREIKTPAPDGVETPLRGEWDAVFDEDGGHLFFTLRLGHRK